MPAATNRKEYGRAYKEASARVLAHPDATWCRYCGRDISTALRVGHDQKAETDHVVPVAWGGTWRDGLVPACHQCNSSKQHRSVVDWLGHRPAPPWAVPGWVCNPAFRPVPHSQEW